MNAQKELKCLIHKNYPIIFIDVMKESDKVLKCCKCISNKQQESKLIYIPDISDISSGEFWPPLSDQSLIKSINLLINQEDDINQQIIDYYDSLQKELSQLILEQQKNSLNQAQKIYEFKNLLISQYKQIQISLIEQIKATINQNDEQNINREKQLKNYINSEYEKSQEYEKCLSTLNSSYQLINQFDTKRPSKIKENIMQIIKAINFTPQINIDIDNQDSIISYDQTLIHQQQLQKCIQTYQKINFKTDNILNQLDIFKKDSSKDTDDQEYLDKFCIQLQTNLFESQINQVELFDDIFFTLFEMERLLSKQKSYFLNSNKYDFLQSPNKYTKYILNRQITFLGNKKNDFEKIQLGMNKKKKINLIRIKYGMENQEPLQIQFQFLNDNIGDAIEVDEFQQDSDDFPIESKQ
ncbi:hypothetical protein ABPG74_019693 [Tetrahymena malaccensis]